MRGFEMPGLTAVTEDELSGIEGGNLIPGYPGVYDNVSHIVHNLISGPGGGGWDAWPVMHHFLVQ